MRLAKFPSSRTPHEKDRRPFPVILLEGKFYMFRLVNPSLSSMSGEINTHRFRLSFGMEGFLPVEVVEHELIRSGMGCLCMCGVIEGA
jgi:hypothetical protein